MGIEVREVTSGRQLAQFIRYPLSLYAGDPCFVPHLLAERREFFSRRNPIFEFTDVCHFLAHDGSGGLVGRVSAHVNRRHNEFWGEKAGFFGFFESVDRLEVAQALMSAAENWLAGKGMGLVRGPFDFSTNEECGLLVDGFGQPPVLMMPYNKPYYPQLLSELGYAKAKDLYAYDYHYEGAIPPYIVRFCQGIEGRLGVTVRTIERRRFRDEVRRAFSVYNTAWSKNWGFVPMTEAQFDFIARNLKSIFDPSLALIAEIDGEPVGFSLALPDYNPLFKRMKGRLLPFGIFIFLAGRRRISAVRVITLGVVPEHRRRGIEVLLTYHTFKNGLPRGYRRAELSWVLEDNVLLKRAVERMGAVHYKTYRIYEKSL